MNRNLSYIANDNDHLNKLLCRDILPLYNKKKYYETDNIKKVNKMLNYYNNRKRNIKLLKVINKSNIKKIFINIKKNFIKSKINIKLIRTYCDYCL